MQFFLTLALFMLSACAFAQQKLPRHEAIWSQTTQSWLTPQEMARQIAAGEVLLMGEQHATPDDSDRIHHHNQLRLLQALGAEGRRVSVGMEFFDYPKQTLVTDFLRGQLTEPDFLQQVGWGGSPFSAYRDQVLFPLQARGTTLALNMPRQVTSQVARGGAESLSAEQKSLLPPIWERGSDAYYQRFIEATGGHIPEEKRANYFLAHCLWDDTMAWQATQYTQNNPSDVLAITVGQFHVEFGEGLPARLIRYGGGAAVKTLIQQEVTSWEEKEWQKVISPDPIHGPRADYIWLYSK